MGKWTDYGMKTSVANADDLVTYDSASKSNKRITFSTIWNWIVTQLQNTIVSKLETGNKTVIGAINEVNGKTISGKTYSSMDDIPTQTQGIYVLSEAIRPDSAASIYMGFCYGNDTSKVVMLVRPDTRAIHINAWLKATGWKGWKSYS